MTDRDLPDEQPRPTGGRDMLPVPHAEPDGWLSAAPGMARIAAGAAWRMTAAGARAWVRTGRRLARAAVRAQSPAELVSTGGSIVREEARRLLGMDPRDEDGGGPGEAGRRPPDSRELRERGARLLARSADVHHDEAVHPAYARILDDLAPDEARILRLLATEGPQPSVDVRRTGVVPITSELVAPGLTMIGAEAGCRHEDQVSAYLNNLQRLGLVWFSREPVDDLTRYQVLEAQPDVVAAMERAGRARTVRRSIHLTPFGADFCVTCLPVEVAPRGATPYEAPRSDGGSRPDAASDPPGDPPR